MNDLGLPSGSVIGLKLSKVNLIPIRRPSSFFAEDLVQRSGIVDEDRLIISPTRQIPMSVLEGFRVKLLRYGPLWHFHHVGGDTSACASCGGEGWRKGACMLCGHLSLRAEDCEMDWCSGAAVNSILLEGDSIMVQPPL